MIKSIKGLTVSFLVVLISSLGCGFDGCSDDDLETIDTVKSQPSAHPLEPATK